MMRAAGKQGIEQRRGGATLIVAVMLFVSLMVAALVVNTAYMELTRTELQVATDLAVRAACREYVRSNDKTRALAKARMVVAENPVATRAIDIDSQDLNFFTATREEEHEQYEYTQRPLAKNAVSFSADFFTDSVQAIEPLLPLLSMQPFRPSKLAMAVQAELDLAIVLDCSSSMLAPVDATTSRESPVSVSPFRPPLDARWRIAKQGILQLVEKSRNSRHQESIGLSSFGLVAVQGAPLSEDYGPIELSLAASETLYGGGLTNLADGIASGLGILSNPQTARPLASRIILLVSDGKNNFGPDPLHIAEQAANEFVLVYTVSVAQEANQELMAEIARITYGKHFHVESADEFANVLSRIMERLPILITQ